MLAANYSICTIHRSVTGLYRAPSGSIPYHLQLRWRRPAVFLRFRRPREKNRTIYEAVMHHLFPILELTKCTFPFRNNLQSPLYQLRNSLPSAPYHSIHSATMTTIRNRYMTPDQEITADSAVYARITQQLRSPPQTLPDPSGIYIAGIFTPTATLTNLVTQQQQHQRSN